MSEAIVSVIFAGPHVSIQDAGRSGLMRFGVPKSGPMDRLSFATAHAALGNDTCGAAIEISLGGLALTCQSGSVSFCVAGGGFVVEHAGIKRNSGFVATLHAGEKLAIRPGSWGSWCILAFAGTLETNAWLGSAATHALSSFGGGKLVAGQTLSIRHAEQREEREGDLPRAPDFGARKTVRVTIGPQERYFASDTLESFLAGPWHMTDAWDRMGVRLAGPKIAPNAVLDMPSEPIVRGSVQVAGDGVASILLADHQTTGGYPKIATVLDCDLDGLMQLRAGEALKFISVTPAEAVRIARAKAEENRRYLQALRRPRGSLETRLRSENLISGMMEAQLLEDQADKL